jgi:hypothetical protein
MKPVLPRRLQRPVCLAALTLLAAPLAAWAQVPSAGLDPDSLLVQPFTPEPGLIVRENFAQRRFDVEFTNLTNKDRCWAVSGWPSGPGFLNQEWLSVGVQDDGKLYPSNSKWIFDPPGRTSIKVAPGRSIQGYFPFDRFDDPGLAHPSSTRSLIFYSLSHDCSRSSDVAHLVWQAGQGMGAIRRAWERR